MILETPATRWRKAVEHARRRVLRRPHRPGPPALVEKLPVDYYGTEVPLQQLAGFSVPEARMLVISPYDKGAMGAIEKAIRNSDLGLNPSNDGRSSGSPSHRSPRSAARSS